MKSKIIPKNKKHLKQLIQDEIDLNGPNCDLNHIDISTFKDISSVFYRSDFNGDISNWNTSNIKNMNGLFKNSKFNGDISKWDTSKVELMVGMFTNSKFNGDISKWNVSNVISMIFMFYDSDFAGDISNWKPYKLQESNNVFHNHNCDIPYWADYEKKADRVNAINIRVEKEKLNQDLNSELKIDNKTNKKLKI